MATKSTPTIKPDCPISTVETTTDTLTGRGGLALFTQYLFTCGVLGLLEDSFGYLRKNLKGLPMWRLFQQVICFFFDGSSFHLSRFDELKEDEGYAAAIATDSDNMVSTDQAKRFFKTFAIGCAFIFRRILKRRLFIWRLKIEKPTIIEMTCDSMPMNNDQAEKRHGVSPTYKKFKGFQPLHLIWNGLIIDAILRGGKKHGNANHTALKMILDAVDLIRTKYSAKVLIVIRLDAGFFDEFNFDQLNLKNVVFIATGKVYEFVKDQVDKDSPCWETYDNGHQKWDYLEFGYRCDTWDEFYHAFYTVPQEDESGQILLDFARPENVILTNIGVNLNLLANCSDEERERILSPEFIIGSHHQRGADELPHRGIKDFGTEALPFKRFSPNSAFYYAMLIAFFLFETFKRDVLKNDVSGVTPVSYPTTVRRLAVDFAAKIIYSGRQFTLKVTKAVMERIQLQTLWQRCLSPPPLAG